MKRPNLIYFLCLGMLFVGLTMMLLDWLEHRGDPTLDPLTMFVMAILMLELNREVT